MSHTCENWELVESLLKCPRVKQGMKHHPSLIPRLLPSLMSHTVHKTFLYSMGHTCKAAEEPGNKAKLTSPGVQDRVYTYSSLVPRASHPSVCRLQ